MRAHGTATCLLRDRAETQLLLPAALDALQTRNDAGDPFALLAHLQEVSQCPLPVGGGSAAVAILAIWPISSTICGATLPRGKAGLSTICRMNAKPNSGWSHPAPDRQCLVLVRAAPRQLTPQTQHAKPDQRGMDQRMQRNSVARPRGTVSSGIVEVAERSIGKLDSIQVLMDGFVHQRLDAYQDGGPGTGEDSSAGTCPRVAGSTTTMRRRRRSTGGSWHCRALD